MAKIKQLHDERWGDQGFKADRTSTAAVLETTNGDYVGMSRKDVHAEEDAIAQAKNDGLENGDFIVMNVSRPPCKGKCTPLLQGMGLTARYWYGKARTTWQSAW